MTKTGSQPTGDQNVRIAVVMVGPEVRRVDTVSVEGELWLVPEWIEGLPGGGARPARLVGVPRDWWKLWQEEGPIHFRILRPVPKAALEGRAPYGPTTEIRVRAAPTNAVWYLSQ